MATEETLQCTSELAASDLSAAQYYFVKRNSSGKLAVATADGDADGILQDKPNAADRAGLMAFGGVSKCVASAAITAGDNISVATGGKAKTADTTGGKVVGIARTSASGNNVIFECQIIISREPIA